MINAEQRSEKATNKTLLLTGEILTVLREGLWSRSRIHNGEEKEMEAR